MKKTIPQGTLRTVPLVSILRPWTMMVGREPLMTIPTNIKKYLVFRDVRGENQQERFTVVSVGPTEHYVVCWEPREKSVNGNLCADSFGVYRFEDEQAAEDVLSWHVAWKKTHDERYLKIADKVTERELLELNKIGHTSKYVPSWLLTTAHLLKTL